MGGRSSKIRNRISNQNFSKTPQPEDKDDQSPSYSISLHCNQPQLYSTEWIFFTATSIPQWRWTHSDCTIWLTAMFTTTMGLSSCKATELAVKFEGCGRTPWHKSVYTWVTWLGWDIGQAMHSLMRECYLVRAKSGIPESVIIYQFSKAGIVSGT